MRRLWIGVVVVAVAALTARGAPASSSDEYEALKKEYQEAKAKVDAAREQAESDLQDATTDQAKADAQKKLDALDYAGLRKFSPRFLGFAEDHADDASAPEALGLALQASRGAPNKAAAWGEVVAKLRSDFLTKPAIVGVLPVLGYSVVDKDGLALVREVMTKNPNHKIQARACKALSRGRHTAADLAAKIKADDKQKEDVERRKGKDYVEKLLADADAIEKEAADLDAALRDKYADVYPDLSVGKQAPEVVSQNFEGKEVKLSALRGKVVVVDIWATWCGPCRAMIPHEKEMVERLKDKPFVLVGISIDDSREDVAAFVAKEGMPWTHWWNGAQGGIAEDWDVRFIPSTYVLDAKGVIRFTGLRGEELEKAVTDLLKELDEKK